MFTRGQIEWAIAQATGRTEGLSDEPRQDLKMKVKRLLDLDRKRGDRRGESLAESFGASPFLRAGLPGKGFAISYTRFDAFALLLGLHLLDANVPQMAVIRLLRRIRPELQREHERILRLSPQALAGDQGQPGAEDQRGSAC